MTSDFDLIVLGAGSGGLTVAQRAARYGAKVALLDSGPPGGTCVNLGCVPKKALWFASQLAQAQALAADYGFDLAPGRLDWNHFRGLRDRYIEGIRQRYAQRLDEAGVAWLGAQGRLVDRDTVEAGGTRYRAPQIVIATGARPRRLPLTGFELGMVSDDIFSLSALPRSIGIVGGGYVATEFACLLRALGCEVEMLIRKQLLDGFDAELAQALSAQMRGQGIRITPQSNVTAARGQAGELLLDDARGAAHGPYESVLWAVGRVPNSDGLGLDEVGVARDDKGFIQVDAHQNTTVPGISAIGDATACPALTPVAVSAGYALVERLFGGQPQASFDYQAIPTVVFADPPLGKIGLTEAQARARHGDAVRVYTKHFVPLQFAVAGHRQPTVMKLVCTGDDERVLGMHALGPGVEEMLQGFAVAMRQGLTRRELRSAVAIHPTSSEEMLLMH
ncbi:glutathione-disulfide reductase [Frateuria sp. STR12]|uniref:glutathione-disulfide reductase n=1 Tax=Frateuria hangzhouensis TaxID=2995589 RepID=UPI002260C84A|nr:glutathione-disulfide reductase [Frateuria sp. STR12]MCX7514848.1 glutathione-disulfide reductase [Frateuria sp. STR12]